MKILSPRTITILSLLLIMAVGRTASAQGPAMARPNYPPPLISLPEARVIIEGEELGELYKTRPDRYFGIMNMYPGKIYLVGGGVPLAVDGQLVGGVGVAGLPEGVDEKSARAGIAAWMKLRETVKK